MVPQPLQPEVVELDSTFRAVDAGDRIDQRLPRLFSVGMAGLPELVLARGRSRPRVVRRVLTQT